MSSQESILGYLSATDYAEDLSHLPSRAPDAGLISKALYDGLFRDYAKLIKAVPVEGTHVLNSLLARYEAENLKSILRVVWRRIPDSTIHLRLFDLKSLRRLPVESLLQTKQITAAVEMLRTTLYYRALVHALPQFTAQASLFPLEMAIDIAVLEDLVKSLRFLARVDKRGAYSLIGEFIDHLNLNWLIRLRHYYGLSPEEAINYSLRGGLHLGVHALGELSRASSLTSFLRRLPPPYAAELSDAKDWRALDSLFKKRLTARVLAAFCGNPFQIRLQLAYLLLKEIELEALCSLIAAVQLHEKLENISRLVCLPLEGVKKVPQRGHPGESRGPEGLEKPGFRRSTE